MKKNRCSLLEIRNISDQNFLLNNNFLRLNLRFLDPLFHSLLEIRDPTKKKFDLYSLIDEFLVLL